MRIRLVGPRLLVKLENESDFFSGSVLVKPDSVHETAQGWGEVLEVGDGIPVKNGKIPIEGVKTGDRVAFIKFLKKTGSNEALSHVIGEDHIIIELKDVLVVQREDAGT